MKESLKAFMNGIIDYAGLYPPADLPLDAAIQNYAQYRTGADAWMLARFIIPAARLNELTPYAGELFSEVSPLDFSVLGKATATLSDYHTEIDTVNDYCLDFCAAHTGAVTTEMLEMKLPEEAAFSHDAGLLASLMDETGEALNQSDKTPSVIFYEGFFDESWKKDIEAILEAIAEHNKGADKYNKGYDFAGFKLRCGGVKPDHFPSVEQVAFVLQKAREYEVALKGTAGLHHPVRHYEESVKTKMHGFFNVFGGAMLSRANGLKGDELREILAEEDAEQFSFTDEAFSWKEYAISTDEIKKLRRSALISYGSCSFDEPREDLKTLKLW